MRTSKDVLKNHTKIEGIVIAPTGEETPYWDEQIAQVVGSGTQTNPSVKILTLTDSNGLPEIEKQEYKRNVAKQKIIELLFDRNVEVSNLEMVKWLCETYGISNSTAYGLLKTTLSEHLSNRDDKVVNSLRYQQYQRHNLLYQEALGEYRKNKSATFLKLALEINTSLLRLFPELTNQEIAEGENKSITINFKKAEPNVASIEEEQKG